MADRRHRGITVVLPLAATERPPTGQGCIAMPGHNEITHYGPSGRYGNLSADQERAENTLEFTAMLLWLVYETEHQTKRHAGP